MGTFFRFYESNFNPTGLSGVVGGAISNNELQPQLNAVFTNIAVSETVTQTQYRKIFVKQVLTGSFTGVSIELANVEHTGQVSFDIPTGQTDTATNPLSVPASLSAGNAFSGNFNTSILAANSSTIDTTIPIWMKQTLAPDIGDDSSATFSIRVRATKI